jgi:hypothetical protein
MHLATWREAARRNWPLPLRRPWPHDKKMKASRAHFLSLDPCLCLAC